MPKLVKQITAAVSERVNKRYYGLLVAKMKMENKWKVKIKDLIMDVPITTLTDHKVRQTIYYWRQKADSDKEAIALMEAKLQRMGKRWKSVIL